MTTDPDRSAIRRRMADAIERVEGTGRPYVDVCAEVAADMVADALATVERGADLTLAEIIATSVARANRWHGGDMVADPHWNLADWSNAMCGEAGELANVVKKIRRGETGTTGANDPDRQVLLEQLGDEAADVLLYLVLVCTKVGVDLPAAVVRKFNAVSVREGFSERIGAAQVATPLWWTCPAYPRDLPLVAVWSDGTETTHIVSVPPARNLTDQHLVKWRHLTADETRAVAERVG